MEKATRFSTAMAMLVILSVATFGCAKKQTIRANDTTLPKAPGQTTATMNTPGVSTRTPEGVITSETIRPGKNTPNASAAVRKEPPSTTASSTTSTVSGVAGAALTREQASIFKDIHFDFDQSLIREEDRPILLGIVEYLRKTSGARLLIEGHCDERGTAEYNMALGERRATSARKYFVALGIHENLLTTVSFGKEKPLDSGHDEAAWAKNRRDHFIRR
ncbi:MAG TPA: OmpA family protein [Candidatus Deferrimicrobiaceae bacterium]|jgi:peptidoglycan-associated lipoprotein